MAGIVCTHTVHESVCSDGTTKAATLHVEGPNGEFDWCGGRPDIANLVRFLDHLRLTDHRVAQRLTVRTHQPEVTTAVTQG